MQSDWLLVRLGDHVDACLGKMLDAKKNKGDMQPYLGNVNVRWGAFDLSDLSEMRFEPHEEERYGLLPGDLVVCEGGEPGRCAVWTGPVQQMKIQKALHRIRPKPSLDNYYLYYWFRHAANVGLLDAHFTGTTIKHLTGKAIAALQVPLPPVKTQRVSVEVLRRLDDRIDLLRQTNVTLESIAQALFKSWFIDFDPVRTKAEGREPEGMDAATAALFPADFEESALGLIPRGWQAAAIQDFVENIYDGPHATPPEATEGPVFLGIKNLTGTSIDLTDVRHIGEADWARWTKRVTPQANDIVFSYEAALGLFALIPPGLRCCLGRRLALVRPKQQAGTPHFWFHQFIGAPFQRLLDKHTVQGATVNRIALKEFPSLMVMDPGEQLRAAFESVALPLWDRIHTNRQQALNLAKLRDSLLPRLVSGKLLLQSSVSEPS